MIPPLRAVIQVVLLRPMLRILFGVTVTGGENLRGLDQLVVVANHNSHLDTFILYAIMPISLIGKTGVVAARDYFSKPAWLFSAVDYLFRPVWVDRSERSGDALREMVERVDAGDSIIIFPEGTRGEPGLMQPFRSGIARLVRERPSVPVVPVFLHGPERSFPKRAPVPIPIWNHVAVGLPQVFPHGDDDAAAMLKESIEELSRTHSKGRHRREPARRPAFTIALLGIDGSGKSTLSRRLADRLSSSSRTCLISDSLELYEHGAPKPMQPLMTERAREWLGRRAKKAKSLARYKIPKLTELLLRDRLLTMSNRWYMPEYIVMDGSPLFNLTAWAVLYREEHFSEEFCGKALGLMIEGGESVSRRDPIFEKFPEIAYLRTFGISKLHVPDAVLFLDTPPDLAMQRIETRGEHKQVHETTGKLSRLREAYEMVCGVAERNGLAAVRVVSGTRDLEEITSEAMAYVELTREERDRQQSC